MSTPRSLLLLVLAAMLGGCASKVDKHELDRKRANSRALEQRRMRVMLQNEDQGVTERGAEIAVLDPEKAFDPSVAQFGHSNSVSTKGARTTVFNYEDRVRTKQFGTKDAYTKGAWMGDVKFQTKAAPVRDSWFSRMTARNTKTFATRDSALSEKSVPTRALVQGDKPFLVKGRRQADLDAKGPGSYPMGGDRYSGQSWSGDLKPMTIDDVKKLLNKN
jgi:hypothetical protein